VKICRCVFCGSLLSRGDRYTCTVCGASFRATLSVKLDVFGVSRRELALPNALTQRVDGIILVKPLVGGGTVAPRSPLYLKSMLKTLYRAEGVEWVCVEVWEHPQTREPIPRFLEEVPLEEVPSVLRIGMRLAKVYKFKAFHVLVDTVKRARVCVPNDPSVTKYYGLSRLYSFLLLLFSP